MLNLKTFHAIPQVGSISYYNKAKDKTHFKPRVNGLTEINVANNAVAFCEKAVKNYNPDMIHEMYLRNLGCAFERRGYTIPEDREKDFSSAIEKYKEALIAAHRDSDTTLDQIKNIYHNLLSGYERLIRSKIGLDYEERIWFDSLESIPESIKNVEKDVKEYLKYARIAATELPGVKLHHSMTGFANMWQIYLLLKNEHDDCKDELEKCINTIESELEVLSMGFNPDNYSRALNNALKCANKLIGDRI